jgi:hypothetical protein
MKVQELLGVFRKRGLSLELGHEGLRIRGPQEQKTPAIMGSVRAHYDELIQMMTPRGEVTWMARRVNPVRVVFRNHRVPMGMVGHLVEIEWILSQDWPVDTGLDPAMKWSDIWREHRKFPLTSKILRLP